ncbi:MAG: chemotaxis protein CheW [Thermincola sp.]|jgi:purine-binding chemotaxis protein CheW|nr:chemotaxis protein CheW [Thermincola sp.]MDT3702092.1 chemotaxis protein CheW [Thermincola sp.]
MAEDLMTNENQYVVFRLGKETYGLEISMILEIITMQTITAVPGTEGYIEGVINLRGRVIPVFNLHKKFELAQGEITRSTRIVVVEVEGHNIGMLVDGVSEVVKITKDIVEKPSSILSDIDKEYLAGVAKLEEKLVILLDLVKVLQREDNALLENIG